MQLKTTRKKPS